MNWLLLKSSVWFMYVFYNSWFDWFRKSFGNSIFVLILFSGDLSMSWDVEVVLLQGNDVLFYRDLNVFLFSAQMNSGSQFLNPEIASEDPRNGYPLANRWRSSFSLVKSYLRSSSSPISTPASRSIARASRYSSLSVGSKNLNGSHGNCLHTVWISVWNLCVKTKGFST